MENANRTHPKARRRHNWSLGWRTAGYALLLAVLLAGAALIFAFPFLKLRWELYSAMGSDGLTGRGTVLWKGEIDGPDGPSRIILCQEEDRVYQASLTSYEGRPYIFVYSGQLPGGPALVSPVMSGGVVLAGRYASRLMALNLPEGTAGGQLEVRLGPEAVREAEGVWDQKALFFEPPLEWVEYEWGVKKDGIGPDGPTGLLMGRSYTLTLWDGEGRVLSQTSGTLSGIWGDGA